MIVHPGSSAHYGVAVTPNDSNSNILHARYLQNIGTSGTFVVRQSVAASASSAAAIAPTAATTVTVYLSQGQTLECPSSWVGVNSTSLGSGVSLVAYY